MDQESSSGDYLLVYLRNSVNDVFLRAISDLEIKVKIYGASEGCLKSTLSQKSNFEFHSLSSSFVEDLAGCNRLLTTAGNQLISEARKFNKYCLLVPEPGQYEQSINAFYAEKIGLGIQCEAKDLTSNIVKQFVNMDLTQPDRNLPNGTIEAIRVIRSCLSGN